MHVIGTIGSDVLGRGFLDDESVYFAFVLDVVFQVRSKFLAVLEPLHLLTVFRQFALETYVHVYLVQLDVFQFFCESYFFDCNDTEYYVT